MAVPSDRGSFGKSEVISWTEGTSDSEVSRVDAARLQHAVALMITQRLRSKGLSIRSYADLTGSSYDRTAKMLRGEAIMRLEDVAEAESILGGIAEALTGPIARDPAPPIQRSRTR